MANSRLLRLGLACGAGAAGSGAAAVYFSSAGDHPSLQPPVAQCDAARYAEPPPHTAVAVAAFRRWLERQGANVAAIDFAKPPGEEGRFGVFASLSAARLLPEGPWWSAPLRWAGLGRGPVALATFPISSAVTAGSALRAPGHGAALEELMGAGLLDERTAVMLHLLVERLRQRDSQLAPWISLLPTSFGTTLYASEAELEMLKGTSLHSATLLKKQGLAQTWKRLEPACRQLAAQAGVAAVPTLDDFLWAYSIFWSRAITFPCPVDASAGPGGVAMVEGLVPGLDFCNHDAAAPSRWTVFGLGAQRSSGRGEQQQPRDIALVCPRPRLPAAGAEVRISYGPKGNEELLFLYGFAQPGNPHEVLMVGCPLPSPGEWDARMQQRVALLRQRGLTPQVFLPEAFLEGAEAGGRGGGSKGGGGGTAAADLPEGVFETLEAFVMEPEQLRQELAAGEEGQGSGGGSGSRGGDTLSPIEAAGLRMAILTTLVRLLELKALQMESPETGTGPLEADAALQEGGGARLTEWQRKALTYRLGQKGLARRYLAYGNALLEREMRHLAELSSKQR